MVERGFSPFVAICFSVNYVVGTGFLTLPWAFARGGLLLSTITLVVVTAISNITKNYVLESMALAEVMSAEREETSDDSTTGDDSPILDGRTTDTDYGSTFELAEPTTSHLDLDELRKSGEERSSLSIELFDDEDETLAVKERKFELTELCRIFLGNAGEKTYITCIALDIYGCLWGFTSVFSSSLAKAFPIVGDFNDDYGIYTAIYAVIVVPISCLELKEQVLFQVLYSVCRFLVIILMILTTVFAVFGSEGGGVYFYDREEAQSSVSLVNFSGFFEMFSVLVFTAIFHGAIPVLSQPVADKRQLSKIFLDTFVITGVMFWILAFSVTSYFGESVEQSANLNWNTFVGGTGRPSPDGSGAWIDVALWAKAISAFVVCFPAINVISSYPLNAIALGNNLMSAVFGDSVHEAEKNRLMRTFYRLISCIPPLVGALYVKDLGIINAYTGIMALATAIPIPALLFIFSRKAAETRGKEYTTYYRGFGSTVTSAWLVVIFSVAAVACIFKTLVFG